MTRYFYVTRFLCREIEPVNIPDGAMFRGWKNNELASVLARYGRGSAFEPFSELPAVFKRNIRQFIERYPQPAYNVEYLFLNDSERTLPAFDMTEHMNRINAAT